MILVLSLVANDDSDSEPESEDDLSAKSLSSKLEDLITCNSLVNNHGASLQRSVGDLIDKETRSSTESVDSKSSQKDMQDVNAKLKSVNEKSQLFRITSNAMINVSWCAYIPTLMYYHITPAFQELHWLHVKQRIEFKILLLAYKALKNTTPS